MFKRKKSPRKDSLYISFYNSDNKIANEYIPADASRLRNWLETRRQKIYWKYGIEEHYGNYGVNKQVDTPEATFTVEELQTQVQKLLQDSL